MAEIQSTRRKNQGLLIKPIARGITNVACSGTKSACSWLMYQPKVPKTLQKK